MTEGQLYAKGGIEKGKLRLYRTPFGCRQVLTGRAPRGKNHLEEVSGECQELQAGTTVRPTKGRSFYVSAKANTTDAKKTKAEKKPRRPSKQGIYRPTTTKVSDQLE